MSTTTTDAPDERPPLTAAAWLAALRCAWEDADAVSQDMLCKPRARKLGPATHRTLYRDASETMKQLFEHAPPELGAPSDDAPPMTPRGGAANDGNPQK